MKQGLLPGIGTSLTSTPSKGYSDVREHTCVHWPILHLSRYRNHEGMYVFARTCTDHGVVPVARAFAFIRPPASVPQAVDGHSHYLMTSGATVVCPGDL